MEGVHCLFIDGATRGGVLHGVNSHRGPIRGQLRRQKNCVKHTDNQHRPAAHKGIGGYKGVFRHAAGLQIGVGLGKAGGAAADGQDPQAGNTRQAQREHFLAGTDTHVLQCPGQKGIQNAEWDQFGTDQRAEKGGTENVARHHLGKAALGDMYNCPGNIFTSCVLLNAALTTNMDSIAMTMRLL